MEGLTQYEQFENSYDSLEDHALGKKLKNKLKKVGKGVLAVSTGGLSDKKLRSKIVKGTALVSTGGLSNKKVRSKVVKVTKGITKAALGTSALLPLQPLRPMMMKALKKKGVSVSNKTSLLDVANRFYNHVVKASGHFDHIPEIDTTEIQADHIAPAIPIIVNAIIAFVKMAVDKKKKGEKLSKTEEIAAKGADEAVTAIEENAKNQVAQEIGERAISSTMSGTTWLVIAGVIGAIVIFFAKK